MKRQPSRDQVDAAFRQLIGDEDRVLHLDELPKMRYRVSVGQHGINHDSWWERLGNALFGWVF